MTRHRAYNSASSHKLSQENRRLGSHRSKSNRSLNRILHGIISYYQTSWIFVRATTQIIQSFVVMIVTTGRLELHNFPEYLTVTSLYPNRV